MDNNKTTGVKDYAVILQRMSALLNLSFSEINKKHVNYPYCLINFFEEGRMDKTIEIRFDKEEITVTCGFDAKEKCKSVYLFPDENEIIEGFISYLKETFDYDYIKNRWKISGYYVALKEISKSPNDLCLVIYG